jgi:hypothetical protein
MSTNNSESFRAFIVENIPGLAKFLKQSAEKAIARLVWILLYIKRRYIVILIVAALIIIPFIIRAFLWVLPLSNSPGIPLSEENLLLAQKKIKYELAMLDRQLNAKMPKS